MATIEKSRVIRPSTRKETSDSYKIDLSRKQENDDVCVTITHESDRKLEKKYRFSAKQLQGKKSIHFKWDRKEIVWNAGITPELI